MYDQNPPLNKSEFEENSARVSEDSASSKASKPLDIDLTNEPEMTDELKQTINDLRKILSKLGM